MPKRKFDVEAKISVKDGASKKVKKIDSGFKRLTKTIKTSAFAIVGFLASVVGAIKLIEAAGERLGQRRALERTLDAAGASTDEFIAKLKGLANQQIATSDIILASNRALALGISKDDIPGLLEAATKASVSLGISATAAFNDITTGVGRASPLILDNLGIVVDAVKIYKDFAAAIGTTVEELTKQQRTAALSAAVIKTAGKGAEDFATAQSRVTVALAQSAAKLKDFTQGVLDSIAASQTLADVIEETSGFFEDYAGLVRFTTRQLRELNVQIPKVNQSFITQRDVIDLLTLNVSLFIRASRQLGETENNLIEILAERERVTTLLSDKMLLQKGFTLDLISVTDGLAEAQERASKRTADIEAQLDKEASALSKLAAALGDVTQIELEKELLDISEALEEARNSTDASSDAFVKWERVAEQKIERLKENIRRFRDGLELLEDQTDDNTQSLSEFGDQSEQTSGKINGMTTALRVQATQAESTTRAIATLSAVSEQLALAQARTDLAATQAARGRITGVSSQQGQVGAFTGLPVGPGTRQTFRVNPDGSLTRVS